MADALWLLGLEVGVCEPKNQYHKTVEWKALVKVVKAAVMFRDKKKRSHLLTRHLAMERFPVSLVIKCLN